MFCHCLYTVALVTLSQSLFLIACSFGYRMYILGRWSAYEQLFPHCFAYLQVSVNVTLLKLQWFYAQFSFLDHRQAARLCSPHACLFPFQIWSCWWVVPIWPINQFNQFRNQFTIETNLWRSDNVHVHTRRRCRRQGTTEMTTTGISTRWLSASGYGDKRKSW